jgi:flagellar export protein FliJ
VNRFTFELDRVLKYKQRRERLAEVKHKQATTALQAARNEAEALRRQLDLACLRLQDKMGKPQDTITWLAVYRQGTILDQALQIAGRKVERATHDLAQAAAARKQAAVEVEVLLTLRHQRWHEHRVEMQRAEQERLDELGMQRWQTASAAKRDDADTEGAQE